MWLTDILQDLTADVIRVTEGGSHGVIVVSSTTRAYEQALTYVRKMGIIVCIGTSKLSDASVLPHVLISISTEQDALPCWP